LGALVWRSAPSYRPNQVPQCLFLTPLTHSLTPVTVAGYPIPVKEEEELATLAAEERKSSRAFKKTLPELRPKGKARG
jgi:hypothetical protein